MADPAVTITVWLDGDQASIAQCRVTAVEAAFTGGIKYRFVSQSGRPAVGSRSWYRLVPGPHAGLMAMLKLAQSFLGERGALAEFVFKFEDARPQ